ncbi:hypothetical protein BU24DRAFT_469034 [Aaosphaeria arxii CBS 175.79]|uniref:Uncharacterized protein n=1 Tax=Aaosphaeria arxii CBS 175.79 TaxID=1450172 RepID=A0A6A5X656_9PLEO|nr:uncharacterized protein BU24DRAFT_469034 [Aaosphaeria arxii CBS 175.79]KAF2008346.1 hypothetical protein BU24DRAFT_469034 [Aaosphaeria arxii CBS 175.79]
MVEFIKEWTARSQDANSSELNRLLSAIEVWKHDVKTRIRQSSPRVLRTRSTQHYTEGRSINDRGKRRISKKRAGKKSQRAQKDPSSPSSTPDEAEASIENLRGAPVEDLSEDDDPTSMFVPERGRGVGMQLSTGDHASCRSPGETRLESSMEDLSLEGRNVDNGTDVVPGVSDVPSNGPPRRHPFADDDDLGSLFGDDDLGSLFGDDEDLSSALNNSFPASESYGRDDSAEQVMCQDVPPVAISDIQQMDAQEQHGRVQEGVCLHDGVPTSSLSAADLHPLVDGLPLTPRLMHSLLYALLPSTVHIIQTPSIERCDTSYICDTSFVIIAGESEPDLFFGDRAKRKIFTMKTGLRSSRLITHYKDIGWTVACLWLNHRMQERDITITSVFYVEALSKGGDVIFPPEEDLRQRFLRKLRVSSEMHATQLDSGQPTIQLPVNSSASKYPIPDGFDRTLLQELHLQLPAQMEVFKYLRILQSIREIGSPRILESLKMTMKSTTDFALDTTEQITKLLHIHKYLDREDSVGHLSVARARYVKYCYYQTFQEAVETLSAHKRLSRVEQHRVVKHKSTSTYRQGLSGLPLTPSTDAIDALYPTLSDAEKKRPAADMVKNAIISSIKQASGAADKRIEERITQYIRHGKLMHLLLQSYARPSPQILILLPGEESQPPYLDLGHIDQKLKKPIRRKDIDSLTEAEIRWFGEAMQALRPNLLQEIPQWAVELLTCSLAEADELRYRDANGPFGVEDRTLPQAWFPHPGE